MKVTVVYITSAAQFIQELEVAEVTTVEQAIQLSSLLHEFPEVSLDKNQVGVYGDIVSLDTRIKTNDRIEVYRPLTMDPMEARRLRAKCT